MRNFAWWLSLFIGFTSLSQEILWVRVIGFAYETLPPAFAFVLANYLLGIALGAAFGKRLCERSLDLYGAAAIVLACAALLDVLIPSLIEATFVPEDPTATRTAALLVVATAALKSILFPIAHHLGTLDAGPKIGRSVSLIYFGNILGSSAGPLVTGFVLLDHLSVDQCFLLAASVSITAAVGCALKSKDRRLGFAPAAVCLLLLPLAVRSGDSEETFLRALAHTQNGKEITHFVTNRHGVVHTLEDPSGDIVYGGNVYDGIAGLDLETNPNRLDRVYLLALLHPAPERVLVIGLATGAWTRALQGFPAVKHIDVVEINPAYIGLVRGYPEMKALLDDDRVHIHIDDGRRWLKRNAASRYDLIVQNTTFHWRANATNLLSAEYLSEVRGHMRPRAVLTLNSTGSFDVLETARFVFRYAYRYGNFAYASDHPLSIDRAQLSRILGPSGAPLSLSKAAEGSVPDWLARATLEPAEAFIARHAVRPAVIRDDNLLTEYAHGRRFGPAFVQALAPPTPPRFRLGTP